MELLPEIKFANDQHLEARLTTGRSGVKRIVFGEGVGRVSYNQVGDQAHFAGMLFRGAPPEYAAGRSIIDYFFTSALPRLGLTPSETSIMRKPIIALELARYGLTASQLVETRTTAGLLVPRAGTRQGRPSLHFIDGNRAEFLNPDHKKYYDVIPDSELPYLYPLENPSRPIDIHTSYQLE